MQTTIPLRMGVQQRVFPSYRAAFFDALAQRCAGGLSIFSGQPLAWEALGSAAELRVARHARARNLYIGQGALLFVWQAGIRGWLEGWQPDVLVADTNPRNLSTNVAVRWMMARRKPVIGWGLGAPPQTGVLSRALNRSRSRFLSHFDAVIAYSQTGAEQFAAAGVAREKIFIAPNAVTPRPAHPAPDRPPVFAQGRPEVLFVGRLQERKRVDSLLRACAHLPESIQPRLVIVGDGPVRPALQHLARQVYPRAVFAGEQRGAALEPYYHAADLFVLPGTGGLAIQQAMSYALPVIVAEADGTQSDLLAADAAGCAPNGWLLPAGDGAALLRTLTTALADPTRLRSMGLESYRIVAEQVNIDRMVDVFAGAVEFVTARRPAGVVQ